MERPGDWGNVSGKPSAEGYNVDGVGFNLRNKDQKWLGLKDIFKQGLLKK